jgi:hypothetical protein
MNHPIPARGGAIGTLAILDSGNLTLYNDAPKKKANKPR